MKKNRYLLYVVLLIGIGFLYFSFLNLFGNNCTSLLQHEMFDIVFINIFVIIFYVYLVFVPLAKILDNSNFQKVVFDFLILKVILLIYEYFLCVEFAFLFDCILLFICVLFVVPIVYFVKRVFFKSNFVYDSYVEVDLNMVRKYFNDVELLKQVLISKYNDMNAAICEFDYKKLEKLCSSDLCLTHKNNMQLCQNVGNKKYFVDFTCMDSKIFKFNVTDEEISIVLVSKMFGIEYVLDKNNVIIEGNNKKKKNIVVKLYFSQKLYKAAVRECPNCGASVCKKSLESCEYCGTLLNYKPDELVITREKRVYDK